MNSQRQHFLKYLLLGMTLALVFAACEPMEGSFEAIKEKAGGGDDLPELTGTVTITPESGHGPWIRGILKAEISESNASGPFSYQWKRGGANISGAKGETHEVGNINGVQNITVEVKCGGYKGYITTAVPYQVPNRIGIYNQTQLQGISSALGREYILANDITLDDDSFTPIGSFTGKFDGNAKTINMGSQTYEDFSNQQIGLFSNISGNTAEVKNLRLTGYIRVIDTAYNSIRYIGAVAGESTGTIRNVSANVRISVSRQLTSPNELYIGGIVGAMQGSSLTWNCYSTNSIITDASNNGRLYGGGISGYGNSSSAKIEFCWSNVEIGSSTYSTYRAGGIIGLVYSLNVNRSAALQGQIWTSDIDWTGRISGNEPGTALTNNYANSVMKLNNTTPTGGAATDKNGADISLAETQDTDGKWWKNTAGWSGAWGTTVADETHPWVWGTGSNRPAGMSRPDNRPVLWFEVTQ